MSRASTDSKARRGQLLPGAPCALPGEDAIVRAAEGIARAAVAHYRPLVRRYRVRIFEDDLRSVARAGVLRALREGHTETPQLYRGARHAVLASIRHARRSTRAERCVWTPESIDWRTPERILIAREELRHAARRCTGARRAAVEATIRGESLDAAGRMALTQARRILCGT